MIRRDVESNGKPMDGTLSSGNGAKNGKVRSKQAKVDNTKEWYIRWTVSVICCFLVYHFTNPDRISEYERQALERQRHDWFAHGIVSNSSNSFGFWLKQGLPDEFTPKVVWFMVWESGSWFDYFTNSIPHVSTMSMASNYGEELTDKGSYSIPIYPRHSEGPYWHGLGQEKVRHLPEYFVLTKTLCQQDCVDCGPTDYVVDSEKFSIACRNTTAKVPKGTNSSYVYPIKRVEKAVHLIRNPFHNVIQRFTWELKLAKKRNDDQFLKDYPLLPKKGFQKWCMMLDKKYLKQTKEYFKEEHSALPGLMEKALCHGEFFKYVQWHNHAFEVTAKMDTHVMYYEDFQKDFGGAWERLLDFVELDQKKKPYGFPDPHDYSRYFNEEHRKNIGALVKEIASETTWKYLQHFFFKNATI